MLLKACARVNSFRHIIATRAVQSVQTFMTRFEDTYQAAEYVEQVFEYYGEIPFLYQKFEVTNVVVSDLQKEPGGHKVVSSLHCNPISSHLFLHT